MKATQEKDATARQKGLEEALATFKSMQPDDKGPRAAYALYHQGRMLALLGKRDEAKAVFEKAKELGKNTDLAERVDERLAGLGAS
jgi:tetratricopeptide (TPR) repeat protein